MGSAGLILRMVGDFFLCPAVSSRLRSLDLRDYYSRSFPRFCVDVLGLELAEHHLEMCGLNVRNRFVCYEAARGHGKTELNSVAYPLWLAFRSTVPFEMMSVSGTEKQTKNVLRRIQNYCEAIPLLQDVLLPTDFHSGGWSATQMTFKNGVFLQGFPISSKAILGNQIDFVFCDDVYGDEVGDIESVNHAIHYSVRPTINAKKGQMIFTGTPKSEQDFFSLVREKHREMGFVYRRFPAVVLGSDGSWLRPQWGERFSLDELRGIRAGMSSIAWSREYMLEAVGEGARMFPLTLLKKATEVGLEHRPVLEDSVFYLGGDVALSDSARADFSAFVVVESRVGEPLRQVALVHLKGFPTDALVAEIKRLNGVYRFARILIEENAVGEGLVDICQKDAELGFVVEGFRTTGKSKEALLSKLEISMRNGQLLISENEVLQDELAWFGVSIKRGRQVFEGLGKHDDCVIGLALGVEAASRGGVFSAVWLDS
jgi:hypothetical protein